MSIKAGSGRGGIDRTGGKAEVPGGVGASKKRNRARLPPPPPKKPIAPVESPFPQDDGLFLGQYRVIEERADYLLCTGYDPNAKMPGAEVTPDAFRTGPLMKVAKPPALQRTPWHNRTVTIGDVEYTYAYSDIEYGLRTVTWTDGDGDHEEEQRIDVPYTLDSSEVANQIIVAVEIKKSAWVHGMAVEDEDGARLRWIDLNVSGRHWRNLTTVEEEDSNPPIVGTLRSSLATADSAEVDVQVGGTGTRTVYEKLGLGSNSPLPAGRKVAAVYMNGTGYVVIGAGCS